MATARAPIPEELIDKYVERHRETLELLSRPEWVDIIARGRSEVERGVEGKSLDELAD
jgi:PHD/YefM family antitoxin component YafN of YafNO toxin-antitoxin module